MIQAYVIPHQYLSEGMLFKTPGSSMTIVQYILLPVLVDTVDTELFEVFWTQSR